MNVHEIHKETNEVLYYPVFLKSCFSQMDQINYDNRKQQILFHNSTNCNPTMQVCDKVFKFSCWCLNIYTLHPSYTPQKNRILDLSSEAKLFPNFPIYKMISSSDKSCCISLIIFYIIIPVKNKSIFKSEGQLYLINITNMMIIAFIYFLFEFNHSLNFWLT